MRKFYLTEFFLIVIIKAVSRKKAVKILEKGERRK